MAAPNITGYNNYSSDIASASASTGVPQYILASVINQESGFNPSAINTNNSNGTVDYGIAQLNSGTYGSSIYTMSPTQQIQTAAQQLATDFQNFGNWGDAIQAYNAGPSGVGSGSGVNYLNSVGQNLAAFAAETGEAIDPSALGATLNAATQGSGASGAAASSTNSGTATPSAPSSTAQFVLSNAIPIVVALGAIALVAFSAYALVSPGPLEDIMPTLLKGKKD